MATKRKMTAAQREARIKRLLAPTPVKTSAHQKACLIDLAFDESCGQAAPETMDDLVMKAWKNNMIVSSLLRKRLIARHGGVYVITDAGRAAIADELKRFGGVYQAALYYAGRY